MTSPPTLLGRGPLTEAELPIIHLVLNTDCNAWDLTATSGSPGVCRFCYRERNRVLADRDTVLRVLDVLRTESAARRVVFTGGDPVMPYDNHLESAVWRASELGFAVNLHTNGLLLQERFDGLREWVDVYSLAIDGPDAQVADWFRGEGYFDRFTANVAMLASHSKTLAFNTFTAANSIGRLAETATMIRSIAKRASVEYWLISQYRPIGRADPGRPTSTASPRTSSAPPSPPYGPTRAASRSSTSPPARKPIPTPSALGCSLTARSPSTSAASHRPATRRLATSLRSGWHLWSARHTPCATTSSTVPFLLKASRDDP